MRNCRGGGVIRKAGIGCVFAMLSLWLALHAAIGEARDLWAVDVSLGADYRRAKFDWNIAGNLAGTNPNVLSELTWYDLDIVQMKGSARFTFNDRVVILGSVGYGAAVNGKNQDSDYDGDNRTVEFLRSNNKGGGEIGEGSIGIGYHFRVLDEDAGRYANVTPLVGYARHVQYLTISDGRQTIPDTGPLANLNSKYNADWSGPWLGLHMRLESSERTAVIINMEYHYADYYAEANWNLRDDLAHPVSFKHSTQGYGFIVTMGISHALNRRWELLARLESQHWEAGAGIDTLYVVTDKAAGTVVPTSTRLNGVNWQSLSGGLAVTYHF